MRLIHTSNAWWIRLSFLLALMFISVLNLKAQSIKISFVEVSGTDLIIYYDLEDPNQENIYSVNLYASHDNFRTPVESVKGDIGITIPVGKNKKIIWHAAIDLGADFNDRITLELKGQIYIPFVSFDEMKKSYKRGKAETIAWRGGSSGTVLTWELYNKKDELVHTFPPVPNVGNYDLIIPRDIKPGANYRFKVSNAKNRDDVVYTEKFNISRKIPLVATVGVGAAAVAGVFILIQSIDSGEQELPDPPGVNN